MYLKLWAAKFKRIVKYWRVWFKQASGTDRMRLAMIVVVVLVYAWWVMVMF
jgi:hypothetical protein